MPAKRDPNAFRPLPFLANPHLQTILGFLWKARPFKAPTELRYCQLPDGDELALHDSVPPNWRPGGPIALMIHGMGGDHRSSYLQRLAAILYPQGIRVVRIDLRGTGAGFGKAVRFYHAGRSEDIFAVLNEVHRWSPNSPLWLIGFSLGGNLALKVAGEEADALKGILQRLIAVAPPIDLLRCSWLISLPKNRVYDRFFANQLAGLARIRQQHFPHPPLPDFPRRLTIKQFDNLFTAPRCGFQDAEDYYRQASSLPHLSRIQTTTLILAARDDPFVDVGMFDELELPEHIQIEIHAHGGHLGFLGYGAGGVRWLERRLAHWLLQPR